MADHILKILVELTWTQSSDAILPPVGALLGWTKESEGLTMIRSRGMFNSLATAWATLVFSPWPISTPPVEMDTVPSPVGLMWTFSKKHQAKFFSLYRLDTKHLISLHTSANNLSPHHYSSLFAYSSLIWRQIHVTHEFLKYFILKQQFIWLLFNNLSWYSSWYL